MLIQFGLYNPNCFTLKKGVYRVYGLCNPETSCNEPIFWSFRITKSGQIRYSFFHPLTKENTIPDYKIRKLNSIFRKKNRAREETQESGKSKSHILILSVKPHPTSTHYNNNCVGFVEDLKMVVQFHPF